MCRSAVNDGSCSPWVMCSCSVVSGNQIRDSKLHSEHYYITLINVVHINKIYILTLYSGYFGKNPGIWAVGL